MKKILQHITFAKTLLLFAGVLVGVYVVFGQTILQSSTVKEKVEVSENAPDAEAQNPTPEQEQRIVSSPDFSSSTASFSVAHQFYLIKEYVFPETEVEEKGFIEIKVIQSIFVTLFRKIVPINAP